MLQPKRLLPLACAIVANATSFAQAQDLRSKDLESVDHSLLQPRAPEFPAYSLEMPSPWSYQKLGLFCKLDVQFERKLRIPLVMRLGDPRAVDALEGKGPYWLKR